ncbi:MAG: HAMP domain-containing histidine kinase, partial [Sulfurimonas sp.]|nr:HAMP domain-containing histidine kinase [Sulfurimonas sp.]
SKTIDDFRSFFRVDKEKKDFKVKETTESVIAMQSAQLKDHGVTVTIAGEEFIYNGFQSEYQQVILNIVNNAKDALVENNTENPTIEIKLQNNRVTVKDNAGGIPEDIIERIFEPYFTTKEQGKGTGMGLYMSKMIIEDNMGGKLSVINESDGACFSVDFN